MKVTQYFLIGNLTVPSSWIASILAMIVAYIAIRLRYGKELSSFFADLIFYFILVWKLSVIITDFKTVIKFPLSIIYFNGGEIGVLLGLIATSIMITLKIFKGRYINLIAILTGWFIIQSLYSIFMVFLNQGALFIQLLTLTLFGAFLIFCWFFIERYQELLYQLILLFIAIHLFIGAFQQGGLLQVPVIATIYIGIFMMGMLYINRNKEPNSEGSH